MLILVGIAGGNMADINEHRCKWCAPPGIASGRQCAQRVAVIALTPGNNAMALRFCAFKEVLARQFQRRAGDPARLVASSGRIRQELGWAPQYPALEQIIDSAWRWHQRHPGGYID